MSKALRALAGFVSALKVKHGDNEVAGRAKSYAERLFEFIAMDRLDRSAAAAALCIPAEKAGVAFAPQAIESILDCTQCYPYFLQEWGKHSWDVALQSPINVTDASLATERALAELDASFFRVRFDRLTPSEKRYMRGMAELGSGPHRSGDVAVLLGEKSDHRCSHSKRPYRERDDLQSLSR